MKVNKKLTGSELYVEVEGSIDSNTAPDFNATLTESMDGITSLIIDFKKVNYISSAGLRVLLLACKTMSKQGKMVVRNADSNIMDIFTMTGFVNILTIEN